VRGLLLPKCPFKRTGAIESVVAQAVVVLFLERKSFAFCLKQAFLPNFQRLLGVCVYAGPEI